jgi:hypothetical protein
MGTALLAGSPTRQCEINLLPLSNLAAHLPPFVLRPDRAMTLAG